MIMLYMQLNKRKISCGKRIIETINRQLNIPSQRNDDLRGIKCDVLNTGSTK